MGMIKTLQTTTPSWEQLLGLLSIILPTLIYLLGKWFDKRKDEKTIETSSAEIEERKANVRKTEAEINETFLNSANTLVEEYKEMLSKINEKQAKLEERLAATEIKLDAEISKRKSMEKVTRELYRGMNLLLEQLKSADITPTWIPNEKIIASLENLEE